MEELNEATSPYHYQALRFIRNTSDMPDETGKYGGEYEPVDPKYATMYSVYERQEDGTEQVIADFTGSDMERDARIFTAIKNYSA